MKKLLITILLILNINFIKSAQIFGLHDDENAEGKQEAELVKVERETYPLLKKFPSTYKYLEKIFNKKKLTEKGLIYSILELCQSSFKPVATLQGHTGWINSIIEMQNG